MQLHGLLLIYRHWTDGRLSWLIVGWSIASWSCVSIISMAFPAKTNNTAWTLNVTMDRTLTLTLTLTRHHIQFLDFFHISPFHNRTHPLHRGSLDAQGRSLWLADKMAAWLTAWLCDLWPRHVISAAGAPYIDSRIEDRTRRNDFPARNIIPPPCWRYTTWQQLNVVNACLAIVVFISVEIYVSDTRIESFSNFNSLLNIPPTWRRGFMLISVQ